MHVNGTLPPTPSSHPYPHPNSPSIPFPPFIHTPAMVTPPAEAKFLAPNTFDDIENDNEMEIEMSNENEIQNHENGTDEKDNRQNKEPLEHEKQNATCAEDGTAARTASRSSLHPRTVHPG